MPVPAPYTVVLVGLLATFVVSPVLRAQGRVEENNFSLVTMLTVGYGDIAPVHGWARSLSALEAFTGFAFGTIVLARLVATYLASRRDGP